MVTLLGEDRASDDNGSLLGGPSRRTVETFLRCSSADCGERLSRGSFAGSWNAGVDGADVYRHAVAKREQKNARNAGDPEPYNPVHHYSARIAQFSFRTKSVPQGFSLPAHTTIGWTMRRA